VHRPPSAYTRNQRHLPALHCTLFPFLHTTQPTSCPLLPLFFTPNSTSILPLCTLRPAHTLSLLPLSTLTPAPAPYTRVSSHSQGTIISPKNRRNTAYHESGHAMVAMMTPGPSLHYVTAVHYAALYFMTRTLLHTTLLCTLQYSTPHCITPGPSRFGCNEAITENSCKLSCKWCHHRE
jgi:hypothetical protein